MGARADFEQAKQFQKDWMQEVKNFLAGSIVIDTTGLESHLETKLGKWYYTFGKHKYGNIDAIKSFEVKHIKLHKIVAEVFEAKNANQNDLAHDLFEDLQRNSNTIIELLNTAENTILRNTFVTEIHDESMLQNANKAVAWDKTKILVSKTNADGVIEYVNEIFSAVSGYTSNELIEKKHSLLKHKDMPKVIYKLMWDELKSKRQTAVILKNKAKSGKYYWVSVEIKTTEKADGEITYTSNQKGLDNELIQKIIEPLYKRLIEIEQKSGEKSSENYLTGYLEERNRTVGDFFLNLIKTGRDTINEGQKGFFGGLFNRS